VFIGAVQIGNLSGRGRSPVKHLAAGPEGVLGRGCDGGTGFAGHRRAGQRARRAGLQELRRCYALFPDTGGNVSRPGGDARS